MNLVDYSDSEGSDSESQQQQPSKISTADSTSTKAGFQKVVDRAKPHKIRVSLPTSTSSAAQSGTSHDGDFAEDDRPAKRAKTGTAFSSFNSFLPAPKNPPKSGTGSLDGVGTSALGSARGGGLGNRFSLKTGAAPSFSREAPPPADRFVEEDDGTKGDAAAPNELPPIPNIEAEHPVQEEVKLVGRVNMFKPLSVARKPAKKKPAPTATNPQANGAPSPAALRDNATPAPQIIEAPKKPPPPPVKKSLFSSYNDESIPVELPQPESHDPLPDEDILSQADQPPHPISASTSALPPSGGSNLQSLADNLNLTASQRRQLFGRSGVAQDARIANFNLAAEYSSNNALIESEGAAAPVPKVRGLAPGKHSLQQLVNAAANQKEALEESFATGRRNKKDAGGRYGW